MIVNNLLHFKVVVPPRSKTSFRLMLFCVTYYLGLLVSCVTEI